LKPTDHQWKICLGIKIIIKYFCFTNFSLMIGRFQTSYFFGFNRNNHKCWGQINSFVPFFVYAFLSIPYCSRSFRCFRFPILSFLSNEILKMKLLLFALLSTSNGYYEPDSLMEVFLKPWTLELINSKAWSDRTDSKISAVSDRTTIVLPVVRTGLWFWSGLLYRNSNIRAESNFIVRVFLAKDNQRTYGPIIPVESLCKAQKNYMHL